MTDPRTEIENYREEIRSSDDISERDAEVLLEFSDEVDLLRSQYSGYRHRDILGRCKRIAKAVGGVADALEDRDAAKDIVRWIHRTYDNEWTNADYRDAIRVLAGVVTQGEVEQKPDSISWIPSGTSDDFDPRPDPADMLRWEDDVKPMIDAAQNPRDKALIAVAFDAGPRSGELQDVRVGTVSDSKYGLRIKFDGRRGERSVTLIPAVPYLNRWLAEHPAPDNDDAPLWSKLTTPESISYRQYNNIFKDAGRRAGVEKPVTPTNFRKSNATYLARQGMSQAFIEDRQGRKRGSEATAHYIAKFGSDTDDTYAKLHGLDVEDDHEEQFGPVQCPRCERETPRDESFCVWCHQALEPEAVDKLEKEETEQRRELLRVAKNNPELLETVEELEPLIETLGGDPDVIQTAKKFVEATEVGE